MAWRSFLYGSTRWRERVVQMLPAVAQVITRLQTETSISISVNGVTPFMSEYQIGNVIEVSVIFRSNNNAVDPSSVLADVKTPLGQTYSYQYGVDSDLTKKAVGSYALTFLPLEEGCYVVRFYSNGNYKASAETVFQIVETCFQ